MNPTLKNLIKTQTENLPGELREYVSHPNFDTDVDAATQGFNLNEKQHYLLKNEIAFILLGLDLQSNFQKNVEARLQIPSDLAEDIATATKLHIFNEIQESLDIVNLETGAQDASDTTPATPQNLPTGAGLPSLIDNRLSGMMRMPKENIAVSSKPSPIINQINKMTATPRPAQDTTTWTTPEGIVSGPQKPSYSATDPYREKI